MYTIKCNNKEASINISLTVKDIEKVANDCGITINNDQAQDVLTLFCANILQDPDSIICTASVEDMIKDVVKI